MRHASTHPTQYPSPPPPPLGGEGRERVLGLGGGRLDSLVLAPRSKKNTRSAPMTLLSLLDVILGPNRSKGGQLGLTVAPAIATAGNPKLAIDFEMQTISRIVVHESELFSKSSFMNPLFLPNRAVRSLLMGVWGSGLVPVASNSSVNVPKNDLTDFSSKNR